MEGVKRQGAFATQFYYLEYHLILKHSTCLCAQDNKQNKRCRETRTRR